MNLIECAISVQSGIHEMETREFMDYRGGKQEEIEVTQELHTDMEVGRQRPHQELFSRVENNAIKEQIKPQQ